MDVFSVMADRRSARAYLNRPVSRADIEDIIEYAGKAPSAMLRRRSIYSPGNM
jgi:nitroreductase